MSATAQAHAAAPRLERPRRGRAIAGVCAGLGRHLNIDPVLVRIAFVVLAAVGGAGFVAYVAAVLLIPEEGERHPIAHALTSRRAGTVIGVVLLVGGAAATIGALVGDGLGHALAWSVVLVGLGAYLVLQPFDGVSRGGDTAAVTAQTTVEAPPPARRHATRVVAGAMLLVAGAVTVITSAASGLDAQEVAGIAIIGAGAAMAIGSFYGAAPWLVLPPLAIAAAIAAMAAAGVVLRGPIGERTWTPAADGAHTGTYQVAIGHGRLDLRRLRPAGPLDLTLRVGIGQAVVELPPGVAFRIHAHAGAGDLRTPAGEANGTDVDRTDRVGPPGGPVVDLDVKVGLGQVRVTR